jgi:hypothetical protein
LDDTRLSIYYKLLFIEVYFIRDLEHVKETLKSARNKHVEIQKKVQEIVLTANTEGKRLEEVKKVAEKSLDNCAMSLMASTPVVGQIGSIVVGGFAAGATMYEEVRYFKCLSQRLPTFPQLHTAK